MNEINKVEILKAVNKIKCRKAVEPDGLPVDEDVGKYWREMKFYD